MGAEADSEIPELGLDSGRINVDCDVSPIKMALRAAKRYNQYRQAPANVRRKHTKISYERTNEVDNDSEDDQDDD